MPLRSSSSAENIYRNKELILQELRKSASTLIEEHASLTHVILFGSLTNDSFGLYSDADILLVLRERVYTIL